METIDITPSWKSLIRPLLDAYASTKDIKVKKDIIFELERLAEVVDNIKETLKK